VGDAFPGTPRKRPAIEPSGRSHPVNICYRHNFKGGISPLSKNNFDVHELAYGFKISLVTCIEGGSDISGG